jgi:two-component system, NarL family, response regulator NreC
MAAAATATTGDFTSRPSPAPIATLRASVIRVLIADLHAVALLHVRTMLAGARDITVFAEAAPTHSAALVVRLCPDVIITELGAADGHGMATIRALSNVTPKSRVLVVSARPEAEWLLEALDAGAAGAVVANASRDEVLTAVRAIMNGQIVLRRSAIGALTSRARDDLEALEPIECRAHDPQRLLARLTGREQSVFRMIAEGFSAPEIGARLFISKKTVETYKKRIGEKLGFSHRSEYVRFALQTSVLAAPHMQTES